MSDSKARLLARNTAIITIGGVGSSLIKMLNVLLFTYFVSVEQVGDYDLVITYVALIAPIASLSLHEAAYRWLLDDECDNGTAISTSLTVMVGVIVIIDTLCIAFMIAVEYHYTVELGTLVVSTSFYTYSQFVTRGFRRNNIYAIQGIVYAVVLIVCNIILIIGFSLQASGLLWSVVIADISAVVFAFIIQNIPSRYISKYNISKQVARAQVRYSLPIVPNNISWWLVAASSRIAITWVLGPAANGVYAISNRFPSMLSLVTTFFYQAWQEQAISEYDKEGRDEYYSKIFNVYARLLLAGVVVLIPVSSLVIVFLVDSSFHDSVNYLGPLFLGAAFNAFAAFYGTGYLSTRKTMGALVSTTIGAFVNVVFVVATIGFIGLYAAAIGGMLGNLVIWMVRIRQTRSYFSVRIRWTPLFVGLAACAATSISIVFLNWEGMCTVLVSGVVFAIVYNWGFLKTACKAAIGRFRR